MNKRHEHLLGFAAIIVLVLWFFYEHGKQSTPQDLYANGYIPPNDSLRLSGDVAAPGKTCSAATYSAGSQPVAQAASSVVQTITSGIQKFFGFSEAGGTAATSKFGG